MRPPPSDRSRGCTARIVLFGRWESESGRGRWGRIAAFCWLIISCLLRRAPQQARACGTWKTGSERVTEDPLARLVKGRREYTGNSGKRRGRDEDQ